MVIVKADAGHLGLDMEIGGVKTDKMEKVLH